LKLFVSEALPCEGNIDPGEREDRGEGIVGRVESEVLDGRTLKFGIGFTRGLGAEANIGKEEWGGIAEAQRGRGDAWAKIIELESGVFDEKTRDTQRKAVFRGGGVGFESAEPSLRTVEADFGNTSKKKRGVDFNCEGLNLNRFSVLNATNFEVAVAAPKGGGETCGSVGKKQSDVQGYGGKSDESEKNGKEDKKGVAAHRFDFRHKLEYGEDGSGGKKNGG
jgi:hypothetical protein